MGRPWRRVLFLLMLAFSSERGLYPKATTGERSSKRILGFVELTFCHTEYGMPSGPGAAKGEDLLRAWLIS